MIPDSFDGWDNMADDETVKGIYSAEHCTEACKKNKHCFQSLFNGVECTLGTRGFRYGQKRLPEGEKQWQSNWNRERIAAWVAKQKPCKKVQFPYEG